MPEEWVPARFSFSGDRRLRLGVELSDLVTFPDETERQRPNDLLRLLPSAEIKRLRVQVEASVAEQAARHSRRRSS